MTNIGYLALSVMTHGKAQLTREQLNSWELISTIQEAKEAIPTIVAKTWLEAKAKGLIPDWAEKQISLDAMSKAAL
jgi:hypothetical protein